MFDTAEKPQKQYAIWKPLPGSQTLFLSCPVREVCFAGTRGPGKRIADTTPVLTNSGWKNAGEITYADKLVAIDGTYCDIIGIFPCDNRPLYNVEFYDGKIIEADDEHRWLTYSGSSGHRDGWKVRTTEEIRTSKSRYSIPYLRAPVVGKPWQGLDPYMAGYIIANGTTGSKYVTIYSIDEEILEYAKEKHGWQIYNYGESKVSRALCPTLEQDRKWRELLGHKVGDQKCIPPELLTADVQTRIRLLQGLMDGDGNHQGGASSRYSTVSLQLAQDVVTLVKSLGGWAVMHKKIFTDAEMLERRGTREGSRNYIYRVNISHHNQFNPFWVKRKAERQKKQTKFLTRGIKSITYSRHGAGVCFAVDHPDHCFVIDDFVVTHNTDAMLMSFAQYCGRGYGDYFRGVIFRRNYKHLDDIIAKSKRWFNRSAMQPKFLAGSSSLKWVWPTGEELLLRAFENEEDYWSYHGHEYPFIGWEELTSWPSINCYESMKSCNRSSFQPTPRLPHLPRMIRSSTNPYGVGHCVPYGEILTSNGWVNIKDVKTGDSVFSCRTDGEMVLATVTATICAEYEGEMVARTGRGLTMEFTPNHRLPHLNTLQTEHTVKPFTDLPGDARIRRAASSWKGTTATSIEGFDAGDFMELLGWFISEGCMVNREDMSEKNSFCIAQTKLPTWQRILALLKRMQLQFRFSGDTGFVVTNQVLADIFRKQGKCKTKHIPKEYLNYSATLLERLLESLMLGDGCRGMYYTLSRQLSDDVQELAIKLGYVVYASCTPQREYKDRQRKTPLGLSYAVSISKRGPTQLKTGNHCYDVSTSCNSVNVSRNKFQGTVYCITVPETETFFIRQKGCVWLSGNSWVKEYFIDPAPYGRIITDKEGNQRVALFGSVKENPYLGEEYLKTLESITDVIKRKAWLEGSWDITSGGMFDDLWDSTKHVLKPFEIPYTWRITRSFDWGSARPFSVGWWAVSDGTEATLADGRKICFPRKTIFRIGEWYGCTGKANEGVHMTARNVAIGINIREQQMKIHNRVQPGPADSAIYAVTDEASIAQNMEAEHVFWTPADKRPGSRQNGWELIRDRLDAVAKGEDKPGFYVFDTCRDFLRTVPNIARDTRNPDDVDTDAEDHIADDCRYMVLSADHTAHRVRISGA